MSDLERYLSSPQAVEDARALLAESCLTANDQVIRRVPGGGPWSAIGAGLPRCESSVRAYFRPDGQGRYIVTDNGEAVAALRLRTGCMVNPPQIFEALDGASMRLSGDAITHDPNIPAADVPRAICAVLLAAHKVASLNVQD